MKDKMSTKLEILNSIHIFATICLILYFLQLPTVILLVLTMLIIIYIKEKNVITELNNVFCCHTKTEETSYKLVLAD